MRKLTLALFAPTVLCLALSPEARADETDGRIYYKEGVRLEAGGAEMKLNVQLQPRFEYTDFDSDSGQDDPAGFRLRRARLIASGNVLDKQFSYALNNDFSSDAGGGEIKDAWLQWNGQATNIRAGRFKLPLMRQTNVSSSNLFFAERSLTEGFFTADRDMGAMAHGSIGKTGKYYAGLFNGDTDDENDRMRPVDNNLNGIFALDFSTPEYGSRGTEGDMRKDQSLGVTAGGAVLYGQGETFLGDEETGTESDFDQVRLNADAGIRVEGFDLQAEVSYRSIDPDLAEDSSDQIGFYVQALQMLDEKWGVGGRFGLFDPDDGETDSVTEYAVGLDYFISGHTLKLQNQATFRVEEPDGDGDDVKDFTYILQLAAYI